MTLYNVKPCVYKDRLFLSAADPTMPNTVSYRTFWYSRPFDFMQWHTGLQGLGGTPNFFTLNDPTDPISGFMVQGDTLVVHRRNSQDLIQPYGTGFKAAHNESGIGFWPRSMMENIPTGHIGWTRYGPGLFNQEGMTVMFPEIERMLAAFNQSQRMNPRLSGVIHDQNRRRVYFLLGWEAVGFVDTPTEYGTRRIIRHQDVSGGESAVSSLCRSFWYSRCPVLVVDYAQERSLARGLRRALRRRRPPRADVLLPLRRHASSSTRPAGVARTSTSPGSTPRRPSTRWSRRSG